MLVYLLPVMNMVPVETGSKPDATDSPASGLGHYLSGKPVQTFQGLVQLRTPNVEYYVADPDVGVGLDVLEYLLGVAGEPAAGTSAGAT